MQDAAEEFFRWQDDWLDIGPGRLSIPWPRELRWQIQDNGNLFVGELNETGSAVFGIALRADDASESVAKDDVSAYLREGNMPEQIDGRIEGLESRTIAFSAETGSGRDIELWQRVKLLGSWLRIALFQLQGDVNAPNARAMAHDIVARARFGPVLTDAEREMPLRAMKRAVIRHQIEFQVPATWRVDNSDDDRTIYEHPVRDEGTLYVTLRDYDPTLDPGPDPDARNWLIADYPEADLETGEEIHMFMWHRLMPTIVGEKTVRLMAVHFNWVILESKFNDEVTKIRYDLLDRSFRNFKPIRPHDGT